MDACSDLVSELQFPSPQEYVCDRVTRCQKSLYEFVLSPALADSVHITEETKIRPPQLIEGWGDFDSSVLLRGHLMDNDEVALGL